MPTFSPYTDILEFYWLDTILNIHIELQLPFLTSPLLPVPKTSPWLGQPVGKLLPLYQKSLALPHRILENFFHLQILLAMKRS